MFNKIKFKAELHRNEIKHLRSCQNGLGTPDYIITAKQADKDGIQKCEIEVRNEEHLSYLLYNCLNYTGDSSPRPMKVKKQSASKSTSYAAAA